MWRKGRFSAKRIIVYLIIFIFGFAAGTYFGYRFLLRPHLWMGAVGESFMAEQYTYNQYRNATYTEGVRAMEAYIAYLDRIKPSFGSDWSPGQSPWLDERGMRFDKMLAWSRLAVLHERNNNIAASDLAWTRAEALAAEMKWKNATRENLRNRIERIDHYWDTGEQTNKKQAPNK